MEKRLTRSRLQGVEASGVIAAASIGAVRLAYEEYYRALGTTVDAVGMSTWRMVTTPLAGLLAVAGAAVIPVFAAVVAWRLFRRVTWRFSVAALVLIVTYAYELSWLSKGLGRGWVPIGAILGAAALALAVLQPGWVQRREQLRAMRTLFLAVAAVAVVAIWSAAWLNAPNAARSLRRDGSGAAGAAVVLDIDPEPVCVTSASGVPAPFHRPVLLLGGANGEVIVRDVSARRTLRLPAGGISMSSGEDQCA